MTDIHPYIGFRQRPTRSGSGLYDPIGTHSGVAVRVVLNRFPELAGTLAGVVEGAIDAGVSIALETSYGLTPVDTGLLRTNVSVAASSGLRVIAWHQPYAAYQNNGTSRGVQARRFAEAGADAATPVIQAELGKWAR